MGEQRERVRRWTASPALASREFGWGGVGHPMTPARLRPHDGGSPLMPFEPPGDAF
jgi:hypothetical protein